MDGYLSDIMHEFDTLMGCGLNNFHGMDPWLAKEDVLWKAKMNYVTNHFLSGWANLER